jgi:hypothetical protein
MSFLIRRLSAPSVSGSALVARSAIRPTPCTGILGMLRRNAGRENPEGAIILR